MCTTATVRLRQLRSVLVLLLFVSLVHAGVDSSVTGVRYGVSVVAAATCNTIGRPVVLHGCTVCTVRAIRTIDPVLLL